jgi:hypothetical protein
MDLSNRLTKEQTFLPSIPDNRIVVQFTNTAPEKWLVPKITVIIIQFLEKQGL